MAAAMIRGVAVKHPVRRVSLNAGRQRTDYAVLT